MKGDNVLIEDLYDDGNYWVARDFLDNIFAWRYKGELGTMNHELESIELDELPDKVREEVVEEMI